MKAKSVNLFLAKGFVYFSVLYLAGIHIPPFDSFGLTPSPIYFWFIVGSFLFVLVKLYAPSNKSDYLFFLIIMMILYLILFQPLLKAQLNSLIHVIISFFFLLVTYDLFQYVPVNTLIKIVNNFINLSIAVIFIETIFRVRNLNLSQIIFSLFSFEFYSYKKDSFMFGDSNSVAFIIITMILLLYYFSKLVNVKYKFRLSVLSVLLFFTFSRAAYLGFIIVFIINLVRKIFFKKSKQLLSLFDFLVFAILVIFLTVPFAFSNAINKYFFLAGDPSFQSKILIPEIAMHYFWNANFFTKLFGIGLGNSVEYIGIWAHNFVITYLLETGIIGLSFILCIYYLINKITQKKFVLFFYLIFIIGFSFVPLAMPYFYVSLMLLYYINKKLNENQV